MSAKFTEEQMIGILDGLADGLPICALAGIAGVSLPTLMNKLYNPAFLRQLIEPFCKYDELTLDYLERLECWYRKDGERLTAYRLRHTVAMAIRKRFHEEDAAEQARAKRKGAWLERGGVRWMWNAAESRWQSLSGEWWRGCIGGELPCSIAAMV